MSRTRTIAAVVIGLALVLVAAWYVSRGRSSVTVIDLVQNFPRAEKRANRTPVDSAFGFETVTIDGETKKCIVARPFSRIIYTLTVPMDGWLETSYALKPDVWSQATDGAQFRIGIAEGRTYDELLRQVVKPDRGDRRWFPVRLDLSSYQGRTVKVIFNTDAGPPGDVNTEHDEAVWCDPRIFSRR
jgi:hypothetical protein